MDSGALRVLSPLATENTTQPAEAERKWGSRMAIGGLAYFLLAKFGMTLFSLQPSNITVLWLPSGIGLLLCLAGGVRALPFILVASFAANYHGMALTAEMGQVLHTLVAAAADTLAAWLAAFMLRRHLPSGLSRPFDLLPFALFVCLLPTLVSASILATNLVWGGYIPAAQAIDFVFMLLVADGLGILVCYPLRELWNPSWRESFVEKTLPWILETGVLLLIVHLAFAQFSALIFLLIPAFLYLTFQERRLSVHLGLALTVCLIVAEAAGGLGAVRRRRPRAGAPATGLLPFLHGLCRNRHVAATAPTPEPAGTDQRAERATRKSQAGGSGGGCREESISGQHEPRDADASASGAGHGSVDAS